jgi:phosphatidylserine decarboxylase
MGSWARSQERLERLAATAVSWPALSRVAGVLSDLRLPAAVLAPAIRAYARAFGATSPRRRPPGGLPDLQRLLHAPPARGGAPDRGRRRRRRLAVRLAPERDRPVPRDGRLEQVKGSSYSIEALLGSAEDAAPFNRGVHATLYLSPAMYHRVHSPVDGRVVAWRHVPGRLFPVNGAGRALRARPLHPQRARRPLLDTEAHGPVAVVLVGAANVGRMSLAFADLVTNRGRPGGRPSPADPSVA